MSPAFRLFIANFLSTIVFALARLVFNPGQYDIKAVTCPAFDRTFNQITNITIEYVDINPSAQVTILLVHGWPSLWSSWARQIEHFKDDYRIVAIDVRGFGGSSHPLDIQSSSSMADITADLTCVLEHSGISSSICLGHDWGSVLCYEAARRRPDVFSGVIGVTVPYQPFSNAFQPIESILPLVPTLAYQVFFRQNTSEAATELNRDITRTLRGTLRSVASPPPRMFLRSRETYMGAWDGIEIPPVPFFAKEEEDYFIHRFGRQGFDHTLMFYTSGNKYETWKSAHDQGNFTIPQPVLSVLPLEDPVADWMMVANLSGSAMYLPQLTTKVFRRVLLAGSRSEHLLADVCGHLQTMDGAHWPHMEFPEVFNAIMSDWLRGIDWNKSSDVARNQKPREEEKKEHATDEL